MVDITQLLLDAYDGDDKARERLWALVYEELRAIAHRELRYERDDHTFSTTDLVHEAYERMIDIARITWQGRGHFYAIACRAMRWVLVDYARRGAAQKRGDGWEKVPLDKALIVTHNRVAELLTLNDALEKLARRDPYLVQIIELRYFGGLTREEAAEAMEISVRTADRFWARARAYLLQELREGNKEKEGGSEGES